MSTTSQSGFLQYSRLWLGLILFLALPFRWLGPFLQQSRGDSLHYVALAMKLETSGFKGYNLKGVSLKQIPLEQASKVSILELTPAKDPEGDLLRKLKEEKLGYYDEPIHHIAYGFPMLLAGIHRVSGNSENFKLLETGFEPWDLIRLQPLILADIQWQWLLIPLVTSLSTILLVYFLGSRWFGKESGLWAAFLIAIHPVDILTSQRIWADDPLIFFCLLALACGYYALVRQSWLGALIAGFLLGFGILIKQSAILFGAGVTIAEIARWQMSRLSNQNTIPLLKKNLVLAAAVGILLSTAHWFFAVWGCYGHPLHVPVDPNQILNSWNKLMQNRPAPWAIYTLGLFCLNPLIFAGCFYLREKRIQWLLSVAVIFLLLIFVINGREYRYAMPILPLLALSAGFAIQRVSQRWKWIFWSFAIAQVIWSFYLTNRYTWRNWGEIMIPF